MVVVVAVVIGCVGELVNQLAKFPGLIFAFWWLDIEGSAFFVSSPHPRAHLE